MSKSGPKSIVSPAKWPPDPAPGTGLECRQVKFSPFTGEECLLGLGTCAQSITSCFSSHVNPGRSFTSAQTCWWFPDLTTWMLAHVDNTWAVPRRPGTLIAGFRGKDIFLPSREGGCGQLTGRRWHLAGPGALHAVLMLLHQSGGPSPGCGRPRPLGRPMKVTGVLGRRLSWPPSLLAFCLRNPLTETPSRMQPGAKQ